MRKSLRPGGRSARAVSGLILLWVGLAVLILGSNLLTGNRVTLDDEGVALSDGRSLEVEARERGGWQTLCKAKPSPDPEIAFLLGRICPAPEMAELGGDSSPGFSFR